MHLREITNINAPNKDLEEGIFSLFGFMRGIIMTLGVGQPLYDAYKNIQSAKQQYPEGNEQNRIIDHELTACALKIAGILAASKLFASIADFVKISKLFPRRSVIAGFIDFVLSLPIGAAQTTALGLLYRLLNTQSGQTFLGQYITGLALSSQIPENTPMYEKFIGGSIRQAAEFINKSLKNSTGVDLGASSGISKSEPQGGQPAPEPEVTPKPRVANPNEPVPTTTGNVFTRDPATGELMFK